jgi:hypothetical protein
MLARIFALAEPDKPLDFVAMLMSADRVEYALRFFEAMGRSSRTVQNVAASLFGFITFAKNWLKNTVPQDQFELLKHYNADPKLSRHGRRP